MVPAGRPPLDPRCTTKDWDLRAIAMAGIVPSPTFFVTYTYRVTYNFCRHFGAFASLQKEIPLAVFDPSYNLRFDANVISSRRSCVDSVQNCFFSFCGTGSHGPYPRSNTPQ